MGNDVNVCRLSFDLKTPIGRKNLRAELRWLLRRPLTLAHLGVFVRGILPLCIRDTLARRVDKGA